ncbi:MAG: AarF/UbiB family protein, partial [bacterium]|nr:AarF/UbiB family protein [bacterium]
DHFRPYLKSRVSNTEEITVDQDHVFTDVSTEIREMAELLAVAGWGKKMEEYLDALHDESAAARGVGEGDVREWNEYGDFWREEEVSEVVEDSKKSPKPKTDISASKKKELLNTLGGAKREAEEILKKWILGNLELQIEEAGIPSFIEKRKGLEKELLTYLLASISPANRVVLERQLQKSKKDADRLLLLGRASHLEKLLQLASILPMVPEQYQKMFAIFQEEVPPRDPIDARRTLEMHLAGGELEKFDVDFTAPLKEGTIAGVYRATYGREPVVLKLIPEGKEKDLRDSLRIVREMRRYLKAGNYKTAGSQAVDDLLVFYEVTMIEELDLGGDIFHAKEIAAILPKGFAVPKYLENVSAPPVMAAMRPAYSRRLKDLSPAERERVFKKVDEELIPAMMAGGVFHYDLHPGNMGLMENGDIILYDTGRVHKMSEEEKKRLTDLYINLLHKRSTEDLKETLRSMGEVWDKKLFEGIDVLLREWIENRDPLGAFEKIYSRFADYGFRLGDSYVKLLFMYITWEGTKRSLA